MAAKTHPAISLLIPIYNAESYLRPCIESALNQTFADYEIVCIDDGSTDSSPDIIAEYAREDPRIRIITKENSGYGASMNRGITESRGTYIAILESDDFIEPDMLETMHEAAIKLDAEVVKCDFWLYWSKPDERNERFGWTQDLPTGLIDPRDPAIGFQPFYRKPSIWSELYRRDFLDEHGIRFLETPGASYQDAGFNFKVWACADRVAIIDRALLHYRQDNENSSVNSPGKVYCVCDEYAEMIRFLEEHPELKALLDPVLVKMRYDSYMWNYERLNERLQSEFILRMAEDFNREDEAGITDLSLFEPWKRDDRAFIKAEPLLFHAQRTQQDKPGKLNTLKRYYRLGGLPFVMRAFSDKLHR